MHRISPWLVGGIILAGIILRLTAYGDLRLSVANSDTTSYVESSRTDLLSWNAFTSYRPFTTNLIFRIFTPRDGYRYRALADGSSGTIERKIDRGFEGIAVLQSIISLVAWAGLAWSVSTRLKNMIVRLLAAALILLFGFAPQIADWDSVMSAESLSLSLFILVFSLLIWMAFAFYREPGSGKWEIPAALAACVVLFFWIFARDVNAYSLVVLGVLLLVTFLVPRFRTARLLWLAGLVLLLFCLGEVSARQRPLWKLALDHVWVQDILPFPARVQYFNERGIPAYGTAAFSDWFEEHARGMYMQFLIAHPGFTLQKLSRDTNTAFSENMQPYFTDTDSRARPLLAMVGNYLHSRSASTVIVAGLLLIIVWLQSIIQQRPEALAWAWVLTWAFLTAFITLFFSIFGDTFGLVRHALSSTMTFRLLTWILLLVMLDLSTVRMHGELAAGPPSDSSPQL